MNRYLISLLITIAVVSSVYADKKERERLAKCATVLQEMANIPDGLPKELLDKAECIVVFPSVKKFALGIGGSYGRGAMVCRGGKSFTGPWGPPAMYRLEGANIGFQLGGQATDFLLLVMNPRGVGSLLKSKAKLGADAAAAAGPKGRAAMAATDATMHAEILSYSRSRGLFAGVSLEGSTLRQDSNANKELYGRKITAQEIVVDRKVAVAPAARHLVSLLQKLSPHNQSDKVSPKKK